jgi:hypothetical protein
MTRNLTNEKKDMIFRENMELLRIIHEFGGGLMLRQQVIAFAQEVLGKSEAQIQMMLKNLENTGFISATKLFHNCNNKVIILGNYAASRFSGQTSRNCWVSDCSQNNKLYLTFRAEFILEMIKEKKNAVNYYRDSPLLITKNNASALYKWFAERVPVTPAFLYDQDIEMGLYKRRNVYGEQDFDRFSFKSLLHSNYLLHGIFGQEKKTIEFIYINSHCVATNKFYHSIYCLLFMLGKYTDLKFDKINVVIAFFSKDELNAFKKNWNQRYDGRLVNERQIRYDITSACNILFHSLDLDMKYSLCRDL